MIFSTYFATRRKSRISAIEKDLEHLEVRSLSNKARSVDRYAFGLQNHHMTWDYMQCSWSWCEENKIISCDFVLFLTDGSILIRTRWGTQWTHSCNAYWFWTDRIWITIKSKVWLRPALFTFGHLVCLHMARHYPWRTYYVLLKVSELVVCRAPLRYLRFFSRNRVTIIVQR